jgi:hypothetical protein
MYLEAHNKPLQLLHMWGEIRRPDHQLPIATVAQHILKAAVPSNTVGVFPLQ